MRFRAARLLAFLRERLWFYPALGVLAAFVLQQLLLQIDHTLDSDASGWFLFSGGPQSARSFLSTISTAVLTMTALVFSVTMLVLQLASSQLSPRVLRTFLRDRRNQSVLALFVATFSYGLLALREVRDDFVPGLTIWAGFVAVLASIGAFIYFIDHMAQSMRASTVMDGIARETLSAIDHLYPAAFGESAAAPEQSLPSEPPQRVLRWNRRSAVVSEIDAESLMALCEQDVCIALSPCIGEFVARGSVVARVWGDVEGLDEDRLYQIIVTGTERTMRQDAAFGFRQLVDIAERALSPGVNDPTTAVQVLDQLHDLLLVIMERDIPSPYRLAKEGTLRLFLPRPDWDAYVSLALDEIRQYGAGSTQVRERIRILLDDLLTRAPEARRAALLDQVELLDRADRDEGNAVHVREVAE